jgi:hypothetical protein
MGFFFSYNETVEKKRDLSLSTSFCLSALSIEEQQQQQQQREEEEEEETSLGSFPPPTLGFPRRHRSENESEECSFGWYSFWQQRQRSRFENTPLLSS